MKATLVKDVELAIVEGLDKDDEPIFGPPMVCRAGETLEFDIVDHPQRFVNGKFEDDTSLWNIQFGDGDMACGVSCEWFGLKVNPEHLFAPRTQRCVHCDVSLEEDIMGEHLCIVGEYER